MDPDSNPVPATPPDPTTTPTTSEAADQPPRAPSGHVRTGKIARLRKLHRDRLNTMLLDGVPYSQILAELGDVAKGISHQNISNWVTKGGYDDWYNEQKELEKTRVQQEVAMDLACPEGGSKIHEATLQLAATRLSQMVRKLEYTHFQDLLRDDPAKLIPFLNSLATISNAELKCEKHRLEIDARSAEQDQPQKEPGLSRKSRRLIEKEMNLK